MLNKVLLNGRITKDPEVKSTTSGLYVCQFSVAVTRDYKNSNGEYDSDFINCVAWRSTAEYLGNYVVKGDLLAVVGTLQIRSYKDQNGQTRNVTEVIVESVNNLSPKKKEETKFVDLTSQPSNSNDDDLPF